jgi:hypothetical protein
VGKRVADKVGSALARERTVRAAFPASPLRERADADACVRDESRSDARGGSETFAAAAKTDALKVVLEGEHAVRAAGDQALALAD